MNRINNYGKHYTSRRRTVEHTDVSHVVIFACDNSFSVVKSKQCFPAEQDGSILIQSGSKKYMGFIFETGKMIGDDRNLRN